MTTVLLVRHGRTRSNADGVLAGRTPGVSLDAVGERQATTVGQDLSNIPLKFIVSSPLIRTVQTSDAIVTEHKAPRMAMSRHEDDRLIECDYGDWTGRELSKLRKEPLWKVVQTHPSSVRFPSGEAMVGMQSRAIEAVRDWNEKAGPKGMYAVCSHGDVIKAILADALGMHLDQFQRIAVDPASVSIVEYGPMSPFVVRINGSSKECQFLAHSKRKKAEPVVGGGAGS